jgi:hypothetical protein
MSKLTDTMPYVWNCACGLVATETDSNFKSRTQPTPQTLPALIKEMQERAHESTIETFEDGTLRYCPRDLETRVADTANATLEYVKGVAGEMRKDNSPYKQRHNPQAMWADIGYNQALTDLIARLTSNQ